jgi:hypothetical protein
METVLSTSLSEDRTDTVRVLPGWLSVEVYSVPAGSKGYVQNRSGNQAEIAWALRYNLKCQTLEA